MSFKQWLILEGWSIDLCNTKYAEWLENANIRIWLDDLRPMPPNFNIHAKTAQEAINLLNQGNIEAISLDHDLGLPENGTGYDVAKWIEERAFKKELPKLQWAVHSANPIGKQRIIAAMKNADRFWQTI